MDIFCVEGESPPVSLIISPSRAQRFIYESLSLSCEDQSNSTGWTVRRYTDSEVVLDCSRWGSVTGSTCKIGILSTSYTGVYWCESESGENSNPVNITVHVLILLILEAQAQAKPKPTVKVDHQSSVYTGDTFTLSCELQQMTGWEFQWHINKQLQHSEKANTHRVTVNNTGEMVYQCHARRRNENYFYYYIILNHNYYETELSDPVKITVRERPQAVLSVSPQNWLTEGDSVTLSCEVTDSSTDWTFSWYTVVPYRDGLTAVINSHGHIMYVELLSDSSRGSGGSYTLSASALHHTGVYVCRGERGEPAIYTKYSNPQPLWISGKSPPVSLINNPRRTHHFTHDSLSLSCEDQSNSTGWTVRRYTDSEGVLDCSQWGSVTGSRCNISFLSTSYTGVYWCESESGENSNPVIIKVHDGDVILESPVHPVPEGHPLTLHCLYRNTNPSNLRADFYKDGSVVQNQTTGEMIIHKVSKSDEGFYHCKHPERGASLRSWISVRREKSVYTLLKKKYIFVHLIFVEQFVHRRCIYLYWS
ncbi:Fc receptor-like protein 5 [Silurus meridionalis]|nr:Fc receptor-like protein 5 [Silurus meridionalis]